MIETAWLNKPDADGLWWGNFGGATNCYMVLYDGAWLHGETKPTPLAQMPDGWWKRTWAPTDVPPPPLPKSRDVKLTARVTKTADGRGLAEVFIDAGPIVDRTSRWSSMPWTFDDSVKWVRDNYGIEPKVTP